MQQEGGRAKGRVYTEELAAGCAGEDVEATGSPMVHPTGTEEDRLQSYPAMGPWGFILAPAFLGWICLGTKWVL